LSLGVLSQRLRICTRRQLVCVRGHTQMGTGKDQVTCFTLPSTRHSKCFCATCGSALPYMELDDVWLVVPAGSLDSDVTLKPDAHIFGSSRANWDTGLSEIPVMEGAP